jgi:serine/threonine-protein kinase
MEYLEGEDLCAVVDKRGALPYKLAVEYVMQTCEALAAAHSLGIIHRDIKPENLFLAKRPQGMDIVKVLDFGVSKVALTGSAFETDMPLIRTMMPMGSPVYMSPEQIRASHEIDARSDIWSLGCVLYELLTGATAFDAPSITQLSAAILEKNPTPVRQLAPTTPEDLAAVVTRCLQKNPDERYQNVADLAIALYPFAPRRARLSAERCSFMLHKDSKAPPEIELLSIAPGPLPDDPANAIPTEKPVAEAPDSAPDALGGADFRPRSSRRRALIAGAGVLLLAALAWRLLSAPGAQQAATDATQVAPAVAAANAASTPAAAEPSGSQVREEPEPQTTKTAPAASESNSDSTRKSRSVSARSARRSAPTVQTRSSTRSRAPARQDDDVDVGF